FAPPLVFMFATFDSNDPSASVALSGIAVTDIEIYKNGVATTRASDAGYVLLDTDGIDFDGKVGIGGFSIDIDNDTDAGFFAAGQEYDVVLASITVDAATINFHAGSFSIERAGGALALLKGSNSLALIKTSTDRLTAVRAAVLTDWINGGRLDLLLDAIPTTMVGTDNAFLASVGGALADAAAAGDNTADTLVQMADWFEQQRALDIQRMEAGFQQMLDRDYQTVNSVQQLASYVQYQGDLP
ncbi:hypothetical protein LCGC14_0025070, partial [marine sediment metagenome]